MVMGLISGAESQPPSSSTSRQWSVTVGSGRALSRRPEKDQERLVLKEARAGSALYPQLLPQCLTHEGAQDISEKKNA